MNKRLISLLLAALLLALLPAAAFAEGGIIVNLGYVRAGGTVDLQIATTETGTASLQSGFLPDGCSIVTEDRGGQSAHFLRGAPMLAGHYEFTLAVTDTVVIVPVTDNEEEGAVETTETVTVATLTCSISVLPAIPGYTVQDVDCFVAEEAAIRMQVTLSDSGTLSYQWYENSVADNTDGRLIEGKTERDLILDTEFVGTWYYYCVITNSNNGLTETVTTKPVTVRVTEPIITAIDISSLPAKLEYTEGDTIDTAGLVLTVHYSNGMSVNDDEGFTVSPTELKTPGTQTVTVTYQGNEVSFPVTVKEAKEVVEAIAVTTLPVKREYKQGERLDTTGLVLQAITNKGNRSSVTSGFICTPEVLSTSGLQLITVSYEQQTTTFTVTVQAGEKSVQAIAVLLLPNRMSYQVGDAFDSTGMVLEITTDTGKDTVRSGFTVTPSRFTKEGTQTVTISYGGKTCTLELTVAPGAETPASTPKPTSNTAPKSESVVVTPAPRPSENRSGSVGQSMILMIVFVALVAMVALLAYVYVSRKDEIAAFWRRMTNRASEEDNDEDVFEDDENNE